MSKHKSTLHKYTHFKSSACFIPKLQDQTDEAITKINAVILPQVLPTSPNTTLKASTPAYPSPDLREPHSQISFRSGGWGGSWRCFTCYMCRSSPDSVFVNHTQEAGGVLAVFFLFFYGFQIPKPTRGKDEMS